MKFISHWFDLNMSSNPRFLVRENSALPIQPPLLVAGRIDKTTGRLLISKAVCPNIQPSQTNDLQNLHVSTPSLGSQH